MDSFRLKEILATFTDDRDSLILEKGRLVVQIHGELIEATTHMREGYLLVKEEGREWTAIQWLVHRIAKLDLLADRIIISYPKHPAFVVPHGALVDQVDRTPDETPAPTSDAIKTLQGFLDRRPAGSCSVLYLTSDAGEGKTTLITELANRQAEAFRQRKSDWLLVPIALGGRPFLRFEDVVAAALMNQLRFPHMYFDSFVELARLGLLVPALDGFEEVFVETSEGEAVSSLGTLIHQMHGEGTLLIAARRAYFEYRGLETQAKLLDGIPDVDVGFGKLRLFRWGRSEFVEYCRLNGVNDPESLYQGAIARIKEDHPLLTRPVLVKRLVEIAKTLEPDQFLGSLQPETDQFYLCFIDQIVEREARSKWIDKHGEPPQPLLTVAEHHELLGYVAEEMWLAKTASLSSDMFDSISDMFAETKSKSAATIRQVRDRIKHHALILQSAFNKNQFQFDHEDFREFFLGEQLGRYLAKGDPTDVRRLLRVEILPSWALDVAVTAVLEAKGNSAGLIDLIQKVSRADGSMSFLRENCGALAIRLMEKLGAGEVQELTLPVDSLRGRVLSGFAFVRCYFRRMRLEETKLAHVRFTECEFERIDLAGDSREVQAEIQGCTFHCVVVGHDEDFYEVYDRERIRFFLGKNGFTFKGEQAPEKPPSFEVELQILQKVVNTFRRCTVVGEGTLKLRLSLHSNRFFTSLLPDLLRVGILQEVKHQGSGAQAHFRLGIRMSDVADLISDSEGSYRKFMTMAQARARGE